MDPKFLTLLEEISTALSKYVTAEKSVDTSRPEPVVEVTSEESSAAKLEAEPTETSSEVVAQPAVETAEPVVAVAQPSHIAPASNEVEFPFTVTQVMSMKRKALRDAIVQFGVPITGPNGESSEEMLVGPLREATCTYIRTQEMHKAVAEARDTEPVEKFQVEATPVEVSTPEPESAVDAPQLTVADEIMDLEIEAAKRSYPGINFTPPKAVIAELKKGLEWNKEGHGGDGLRPATVSWARRMANGQDISPEKAVKMRAWLARHESDKSGKGFSPGEEGFPSPGRVAWALWGGDPAVGWSNKLVTQMEAADRKKSVEDVAEVEPEVAEAVTLGAKAEQFLAWVVAESGGELTPADTGLQQKKAEELGGFFEANLPFVHGTDREPLDQYFQKLSCEANCKSCPHGTTQAVFCYGVFDEEVSSITLKDAVESDQFFLVDSEGNFAHTPTF